MRSPRTFFTGGRPLAFAHRGGGSLWPENTLVAFRGALELGCEYLETDVHLTRDGRLVVFHDAELERTTDGFGPVRAHTFAELQRLDAGYRFTPDGVSHPWRDKGVRIPLLEEVFALDPSVKLNVEMKQTGVGLPEALWAFVNERKLHDRILVAAAHHRLAQHFRRLSAGSVATSASAREVIAFWLAERVGAAGRVGIEYDALQVPVRHAGLTVITPSFIEAAHARGVEVHVWTIDAPAEMRRLLELGADGLMSDRPDVLMNETRRSD